MRSQDGALIQGDWDPFKKRKRHQRQGHAEERLHEDTEKAAVCKMH
jgi:hypothetical protein